MYPVGSIGGYPRVKNSVDCNYILDSDSEYPAVKDVPGR
nr:MAG TPA: hypothetical protein [Caudoviricetes sp.]